MLFTAALLAVVAGSIVYSLLTLIAAREYLSQGSGTGGSHQPISVLKPLSGAEDDLEQNLRTFFIQRTTKTAKEKYVLASKRFSPRRPASA